MANHTRFYIDLNSDDYGKLQKLSAHLSLKMGITLGRADTLRLAIQGLAKKEKVA